MGSGCTFGALPQLKRRPPWTFFALDQASFLLFRSTTGVVADLARPFAQFLIPVICSAISFDNGTRSLSTPAVVRSHSRSRTATGRIGALHRTDTKTPPQTALSASASIKEAAGLREENLAESTMNGAAIDMG